MYEPVPPFRRDFDAARDPYTGRNALGITGVLVYEAPQDGTPYERQDGAWVPASSGGGGGIPDAPSDGTLYGRLNGTWSAAQPAGSYLTGNQTITLSGDVTGSGTTAITTAIANNAVTNAALADMGTARIKARITASTGDPEDATGTQVTTLLDVFTSTLKGLAPSSGGGTSNFLRADGTWAAPPAGGGGITTVSKQIFATTSGTYTPTTGMKFCIVECIGGGGAGGGCTSFANNMGAGGGGGSGGYSRIVLSAATVGASQTVTIGSGGNGVSAGNGGAGVDTSFGSLCIAKGGSGGISAGNGCNGGAGGVTTGAVGDVTAAGNHGHFGGVITTATGTLQGGGGGSSIMGGGANAGFSAGGACNVGPSASNYGSGGAGATFNNVASTNAAGGAGSKGIVIVTEFI